MSTAIADIEYNPKTRILRLAFAKGGGHVYYDVPAQVVDELKNAGSQGAYFNANIRKVYG